MALWSKELKEEKRLVLKPSLSTVGPAAPYLHLAGIAVFPEGLLCKGIVVSF